MDRLILLNMFALLAILLLSSPDHCEGLSQRLGDYYNAKQTEIMDVDQGLSGDMDASPPNRGEPEEGEVFYRKELKLNVLRKRSVDTRRRTDNDKLEKSMLMLLLY